MPQPARTSAFLHRPAVLLAVGAVILALSLGIRHGFGLFLQPMSMANGWGREVFAFAIALQNLIWGATQPFVGAIADRYGAGRVIIAGTLLYALGLLIMAAAALPTTLALGAGVAIGVGLSGTSFTVVLAAISRAVPPDRRSFAMGVAAAAGSFGQFVMLPGTLTLIEWLGWSSALVVLAGMAVLMAPLAAAVDDKPGAALAEPELTARQALKEAAAHRGFWLLSFGFFVCGFQVVFIGVHLPAFLLDRGLSIEVGTTALALVGLFNIAGTYCAGLWGGRWRKPLLLAGIYGARAVVIVAFAFTPITTWSAYAFGATMGFLWLGTVPLTNGTVASVFGVRNMSMLTGIVFFFHQVGAFFGGWLGGVVFDRTGSYDVVWLAAIALSLVAMVLNLPIRETPVARLRSLGATG
ncbi:MAG: MFS transporter [Rhodospirillales bacterium]